MNPKPILVRLLVLAFVLCGWHAGVLAQRPALGAYTTRAGLMPVGENPESPTAELFYTAYTLAELKTSWLAESSSKARAFADSRCGSAAAHSSRCVSSNRFKLCVPQTGPRSRPRPCGRNRPARRIRPP